MSSTSEQRIGAPDLKFDMARVITSDRTYECRVLLCPEEEGGFSAFAMKLPGVMSQGDSEQEALENIKDAFQAAIQSYTEAGKPVPWMDGKIERPAGSFERWVLVNV